ncbi:MAG: response regulator [Micropepsaceae bacterium]
MATILVVEDDTLIREVAILMIEDWGHTTLSASDVSEATELLQSSQKIDALFTDIYLKSANLGGCDVAQIAVRLRPLLRVLYTTGNTVTEKMKSLLVLGTSVLLKPYTEQELQTSISKLLAA